MASITPYNQVLGIQNAAHLLRRATLGATRQQIDQFAQLDATTAVTRLLTTTPLPRRPLTQPPGKPGSTLNRPKLTA